MDPKAMLERLKARTFTIDPRGHKGFPLGTVLTAEDPEAVESGFGEALESFSILCQMMVDMQDRDGVLPENTDRLVAPALMLFERAIGRCGECGARIRWQLAETGAEAVEACAHPGGVGPFTVAIDVPSGRLVFANDLRPLVRLAPGHDNHYVNVDAEIVRCSKDYADAGMVHVYTGNTSPNVYLREDGTIEIANPGWDKETCEEIEGPGEKLGCISTSLWWFSAMDGAAFDAACARHGQDPNEFDVIEVAVEPGLWEFSSLYHCGTDDPDGHGPVRFSLGRRIGEARPPRVREEEPEAIRFMDSVLMRHFQAPQAHWKSLAHFLAHVFCTLGGGFDWVDGQLTQQSGLPKDTPFAADADDAAILVFDDAAIAERIDVPARSEAFLSVAAPWMRASENDAPGALAPLRVYPLSNRYGPFRTPLKADPHSLAAQLVVCEFLVRHPEHLDRLDAHRFLDGTPPEEVEAGIVRHEAEQIHLARRARDLIATIVETRGLWDQVSPLTREISGLLRAETEKPNSSRD